MTRHALFQELLKQLCHLLARLVANGGYVGLIALDTDAVLVAASAAINLVSATLSSFWRLFRFTAQVQIGHVASERTGTWSTRCRHFLRSIVRVACGEWCVKKLAAFDKRKMYAAEGIQDASLRGRVEMRLAFLDKEAYVLLVFPYRKFINCTMTLTVNHCGNLRHPVPAG